jgi:hypothetical protein
MGRAVTANSAMVFCAAVHILRAMRVECAPPNDYGRASLTCQVIG